MKTTIGFLLLFCAALSPLKAETTVVVVDFQTVFEEYRELQRLDQEFRAEVEAFRKTQQAEVEALQAKQQEFNQLRQRAARPEVTAEEREAYADEAAALLEEMGNEEQRIRRERQTYQQELEAKGVRLRSRVVEEVHEKIEQFALSQGWDVVLDRSAKGQNGLPVVPYAGLELDKTRWVITELNAASAAAANDIPDAASNPQEAIPSEAIPSEAIPSGEEE